MYRHSDYVAEFRDRSGEWWKRAVAFARGEGPPPKSPYQVELHLSPTSGPQCRLRCIDCHGQFLRRGSGMDRSCWLQLLEDLDSMRVPSVVLSGNYSDPAADQSLLIEVLKRSVWGVKLHTYGIDLTDQLSRSILAAAFNDPDSYVSLSKVTTDPEVHALMCRPHYDSAANMLRYEEANLVRFFNLARSFDWPLSISINCRLTRINGTQSSISGMLGWLESVPSQVKLRFTTDYIPTSAEESYRNKFNDEIYLDAKSATLAILSAIEQTGFHQMERLSFRFPETVCSSDRCYSNLLLSAVSTSGQVFPCQGIASPRNGHLAYGDLQTERFPTIWNRFVEHWKDRDEVSSCPHCQAPCERQLNEALHREVSGGSDGSV